MPDPRLMRQQGQRSWLRAFILDLCPFFMPDPRLLDPFSLFLTDERSDAAVVGSGNKAMGTSPFLTF